LGTDSEATTIRCELWITNAGVGPAFAIEVQFIEMPFEQQGVKPSVGAQALLGAGQQCQIAFAVGSGHGPDAWLDRLREDQPLGDLLITCRDSFGELRSTRGQIKTGRRLATDQQAYPLRISPPTFDEYIRTDR
jgi:hypothetical protein